MSNIKPRNFKLTAKTNTRRMRKALRNGKRLVCLISSDERYGGPEEGGWYYNRTIVDDAVRCPNKAIARRLKKRVSVHCVNKPSPSNGYYCEFAKIFVSLESATEYQCGLTKPRYQ